MRLIVNYRWPGPLALRPAFSATGAGKSQNGRLIMSLLTLANDFPPSTGGIQRYLYGLAVALHHRGEEVVVIATEQPQAAEFDATSPVPTLRVPAARRFQAARSLASAAINYIREGNCGKTVKAILAGNWWPDGYAAWLVRRQTGTPYVVMGYGREMVQTGANPIKWLMQQLVIRGASGGLAISHYSARQLSRRGLPQDRGRVIYGGVDPAQFAAPVTPDEQVQRKLAKDGQPILLTVSRLVRRKGHSQVIAALPQIASEVGPVKYIIVGSGPEEQRLRRLAGECGTEDCVEFMGEVDDRELPALYQTADVFAMPSRDLYGRPIEGLGLVYLEANLCGLPVVAGDTGGVSDAVVHGETGLLVNPEDPAAIASAIIRLLSDPDLAAQMGAAGQARVLEEFTWERVAAHCQRALTDWGLSAGPPEVS